MLNKRNKPDVALLFGEMTHRVVNEYTSATMMLSLSAAKVRDPEARIALQNTADRLHDYAIAYRALQKPVSECAVDLSEHISDVCRAIYRSRLHGRGISLEVARESIALSADQCWYIGLIVSELITNAVKHAFRESGGSIRVEMQETGNCVQRY
jgi:two-component sensor histidine kinase